MKGVLYVDFPAVSIARRGGFRIERVLPSFDYMSSILYFQYVLSPLSSFPTKKIKNVLSPLFLLLLFSLSKRIFDMHDAREQLKNYLRSFSTVQPKNYSGKYNGCSHLPRRRKTKDIKLFFAGIWRAALELQNN